MDNWTSGSAYEAFIGGWSRLVAAEFVPWLAVPGGARWLDVGCGTGALTQTVLSSADPERVTGVDSSPAFLDHARQSVTDPRATFEVGDAQALPLPDGSVDAVVSALVLNFVPDPARAAGELVRVARPGAVIGAYLWDSGDGMQMLRQFWDAAATVDPRATQLDERPRFPLCAEGALADLFRSAGLPDVAEKAITVPTHFRDFDELWRPFLGGQGPAPSYLRTLESRGQEAVREQLRSQLPIEPDGAIRLTARAWAVRAARP